MRLVPISNNITLSQLAESLALVTTFSALIGVSYKFGFYQSRDIDATWLISLFTPIDFMMANIEIYGYYFLAALYMSKVFDTESKERGLELALQGGLIVALGVASYLLMNVPIIHYVYIFFSFLAFYLLLYRAKVGKMFGMLIILFIPLHMGSNALGTKSIQELPHVALENSSTGVEQWYLLDKYSDKAILVNKDIKKNKFKIVELTDIEYIENSHSQ